jgi:hypothetical protein
MQPIKTTNAMNPAPAKGIQSLPTPVIDDVIITEVVNAWKGNYEKLEYGTMWDSVPHGSQQGSFPEHKLVFQQVSSEDGQWVKRIWANDRVNQDGYNYAIKYSAGSQEHPIYIRTYVLPRETYAPLLDGTPDPLFPSALLVDEEATRIEGELDSKYITVTRVYETIPGPTVPTRRYNERGDLETVLVQTVPPNTPPDPDGLLVTSSQVEQVETGKGVKTTSTVPDHSLLQIKEKKDGLLGETITTDDIVDPSTNPDALSQTIVSSIVEQFSATKARKRTTTALGPTSLTQKSNDGKLTGNVIVTESVVDALSNPDAITASILSSEVQQVDSGKAIKKNTVIKSTPILTSKRKSGGLMGITKTVETVVPAETDADALDTFIIESIVEPINSSISRKATTTQEGPTSLVGGTFKDGLLGQTQTIESIVTASSTPDQLSQTVISSIVEPIDSIRSKKTTITSTGPTSLTQKSKDGKLLGDVTLIESIVAPNAAPDAVSTSVLSSEIKQIDTGKSVKKNTILNSTPVFSGHQNEQGLLGVKSTVESVVLAGASADVLSLSVISSQVEPIDSVRSKKTTITSLGPTSLSGSQKKEGLLGEVNVVESIVASGSQPDTLTQTIISSQVDIIDSAKSKKTTITSVGPTSLSQKSKDGKLLGDVTSTESIVAPDVLPDALSATILSSDVKQIDSGKAIKTNVVLNGTPTLLGNQNDQGLLGNKKTIETIVPAGTDADALSQTILSSQVEPIDSVRSKKTTITSTGPNSLTKKSYDGKLLGNLVLTQSIVDPNSSPDNISESILSSEVEQIDSGKAQKNTVTLSSSPILTSKKKSIGLMGNTRTVESIVSSNSDPDQINTVIVESSIESINSSISRKSTTFQDGPNTLSGFQNKDGLLGKTKVTESIVPAGAAADAFSKTIISSSVEPIDSAKSKKITIESTGPDKLDGARINQRGELENTTEEIVTYGTLPDQDNVKLSSSEVQPIDNSKSKKLTTKVLERAKLISRENKGGLLGDTFTEDTIVAPNTLPDDLNFAQSNIVIESSVKALSSGKSNKITVKSNGPISLNCNSLVDSPLGLVKANIKKSVVSINEQPQDGIANINLLKDSISPIDQVKSERETIETIGWPINSGADYDDVLGIGIPYKQTIVPASELINNSAENILGDYQPLDQWKTLKKQIDINEVRPALNNRWYKFGVDIPIKLPDKLISVNAYYGRSFAEADDYDFGVGVFKGSYNRNQSGTTKSSSSLNGDIYFEIENGFDGIIQGYQHIFFLEIGNDDQVTGQDVLQRLNYFEASKNTGTIYKRWPYLRLTTENIVLITGGKSESKSESLSQSVSINGISKTTGKGTAYDVNVNASSVNIPATLHGLIKISEDFTGNPIPQRLAITYGVNPKTLKPTKVKIDGDLVEAATFPTGDYLYSSSVDLYKYGFVKVTAKTVSITNDYT